MADDPGPAITKKAASSNMRVIHGAALGYQPFRMKPVHFATGFVRALTGRTYRLEMLNKVSIPKASPQSSNDSPDPYHLDGVRKVLVEAGRLHEDVETGDLGLLRSHLQATMDNDGASYPMFAPYKGQSSDYSLPSVEYASDQSKNHGRSGDFVLKTLQVSTEGRRFIELARGILEQLPPPQADLGRPLLDPEAVERDDDYNDVFGQEPGRFERVAALMSRQTAALVILGDNIARLRPLYAVRYLMLGVCAWLYLYMMRRNDNEPVLLVDACRGLNPRTRSQSCAAYARQLNVWSNSYDRWSQLHPDSPADWARFAHDSKLRTDIDDHFRDFGVRIGFVQPRASQAPRKHFELAPDTLRVLSMSVLQEGEVLAYPEFVQRLRDAWSLYTGGGLGDGELLFKQGFSPLDEDDDLKRNANEFASLLINLGLAVEPSDGLVLCALDVAELI